MPIETIDTYSRIIKSDLHESKSIKQVPFNKTIKLKTIWNPNIIIRLKIWNTTDVTIRQYVLQLALKILEKIKKILIY